MSLTLPSSEELEKLQELESFLTDMVDESEVNIFRTVKVGNFGMINELGGDDIPYCLILPGIVDYPDRMPYVGNYGIQLLMVFSESNVTDEDVENLRSYILTKIVKGRQGLISTYEIKSIQRGEVMNIRGISVLFENPYMAISFELETVVRSLK